MDVKQARLPDAELVQMIRSRSRKGAEALYDGYANVLLLVIIRVYPQKEIAENVLEDTFVKIWNSVDLYSMQDGSFLSWMIAIAKKTAKENSKSSILPRLVELE
jgi:DNA-directed RNA polymerase specialized sigma24 family protein